MKNKIIFTKNAPAAIGPYSQAILAENNTLYLSGALPIVPETGEFNSDKIEEQTKQCLKNIYEILKATGKDIENIVKTTVFLADINDFAKMNEAYSEFFKDHKPARSAFQVGALPKNSKVEIEVIAV